MTQPETRPAYGALVQEYQLQRVRQHAATRRQTIDNLASTADAKSYSRLVQARLKRCFGKMPKRVPLKAKVAGVVDRPTYTIEKVMFQSRPDFWVTANLYMPKNIPDGRKKIPAVLGSCGHGSEGKALPNYQGFARLLANNGFACLIYDPIGQGERHQYLDQGQYVGPVGEHQIAGNQMSLLGDYFGMWRAWDGIVGIDYLLSRPEIDKKHIGMTGNSGGGTLTTFISMLDKRITMAAASCLGSDYLMNLENELPCDSEQNPPGAIANDLNYADFFIAQAPRPSLILAAKDDFFDLRGLDQIHADMQRVFGLMGKKHHARIHRGEGPHGYSKELRQAMCRFFCEIVGYKPTDAEPDWPLEKQETLWVTPQGQLSSMKGQAGGKRVHDFTAAAARELQESRKPVKPEQLPRVLTKLLSLPARKGVAHYRTLRALPMPGLDGQVNFRWGIETEGHHMLAILQARRHGGDAYFGRIPVREKMDLYLPHISSDEDQQQGHFVVKKGDVGFSLDVRGIGEMRSRVCGDDPDFFLPYDADFFHAAQHQMLGDSYLGRRVHDVLVTLDLLASRGTKQVNLTGRGLGAVIAAFAAAIHPAVKQVTLKNAPRSFHEMTQTVVQQWPLSSLPWGVLQVTDLPEIYDHLRQRKSLRLVQPWNAKRQPGKAVK